MSGIRGEGGRTARRMPSMVPVPAALRLSSANSKAARPRAYSTALTSAAWIALITTAAPWSVQTGDSPALVGLEGIRAALLGAVAAFALFRLPRAPLNTSGILLVTYVLITALPSLLGGAEPGSLLRSVRLLISVVVAFRMINALGVLRASELFVIASVVQAFTALAAWLVGIVPLSSGRLLGVLPPLHPNGLGLLTAMALVLLLGLWVDGKWSPRHVMLALVPLLPSLYLSRSRTSMIALLLAVLMMAMLRSSRARLLWVLWGVAVGFTSLALVEVSTRYGLLENVVTKNGLAAPDATLTGRSYAWDAVLNYNESWVGVVFGNGLALKSVPVQRLFVDSQTIDGTWHSAFIEAGLLGLVLLLATCAAAAFTAAYSRSAGLVGLYLVLIVSSLTTSILNDMSIGFLLLCLFCQPTNRLKHDSLAELGGDRAQDG